MTPAQISLLKRLIEADRRFHSIRHARGDVSENDRGVEVGWINGVDPRTAQSLCDAGLAESTTLPGRSNGWLFLGSVVTYDEIED